MIPRKVPGCHREKARSVPSLQFDSQRIPSFQENGSGSAAQRFLWVHYRTSCRERWVCVLVRVPFLGSLSKPTSTRTDTQMQFPALCDLSARHTRPEQLVDVLAADPPAYGLLILLPHQSLQRDLRRHAGKQAGGVTNRCSKRNASHGVL